MKPLLEETSPTLAPRKRVTELAAFLERERGSMRGCGGAPNADVN